MIVDHDLPASWLTRLDPRVKLWYALLVITLAMLSPNLGVLAGLLIASQVVLIAGRVPLAEVGRAWRLLGVLLAFILILQPVIAPGEGPALWTVGPVRITAFGLLTGARYALRMAAAAFAVMVLVTTTATPNLVRGLEKLGLPHNIGLTVGLALRYLGTVGALWESVGEAQQARGLDLAQRGMIKRIRAAVPTLVAVIIATLRLSDTLALGLAARGFGYPGTRTHWRDLQMTRFDWLALATISAISGLIATLFLI
jgi:energy-coupling factor transport system permease protein